MENNQEDIPTRIFLQRLNDLSRSVPKLHHHIKLNASARADIKWWLDFQPSWNGIGLMIRENAADINLRMDQDP